MRRFSVVLAAAVAFLDVATALSFRPTCPVTPEVLEIQWNGQEYVLVGPARHLDELALQSGERGASTIAAPGLSSLLVRDASEHERLLNETSQYVRYCTCNNYLTPVYCPMTVNHCGAINIRGPEVDPMYCFNTYSRGEEFAQNSLLVIMASIAITVVCVVCTGTGKNCLCCIAAQVFPCWNNYMADRMLEHDPDRAQFLIRRNLRIRRRRLMGRMQEIDPELLAEAQAAWPQMPRHLQEGLDDDDKPTSLRLRTKIYHFDEDAASPKSRDVEEEEDLSRNCVICFQPLVDGDRVGALTCDHTFHVACLKSWLQRRNVCPLCQTPNIADPQYDRPSAGEPPLDESRPDDTTQDDDYVDTP